MIGTFYPEALRHPLSGHSWPGTLAQRTLIVDHIAEAGTAQGIIATFEASRSPGAVSAHFVIDQIGTVYQLLPLEDSAWHASQVNQHSVGIEHAAISDPSPYPHTPPLPITDAQYAASAKLHKWLCGALNIPVDRAHIRSHNEASPADRHTGCCEPTLDLDKLVRLTLEL